jgi:glycosyltransferase involved in cell wall biosynthesis
MRIVVCDNQVPFVHGGAEKLREALVASLRRHGHEVETALVPYRWYPANQIVRHMLAWRLLDLRAGVREIDRVIALRFPAYLARHPDKVLWITSQHRTAYDLWDTDYCDLKHFEHGRGVRRMIMDADDRFLPEAKRLFAISRNVADRLQRFNDLSASVLYPPVPDASRFHGGPSGDYIFYASRLDRLKRHEILIRAMAKVPGQTRCLLAGRGPEERNLRQLVADLGLEQRVKLVGHVTDAELVSLYSNALAVYYGPYDEDFGYGVLEAFLSEKPVLTFTDSGGPLEFVRHDETGIVIDPTPDALAESIVKLVEGPARARAMGRQGREAVGALGLSWDAVVEKLTA